MSQENKVKVAIVGATGAVGRCMVEDLAELIASNVDLQLFASPKSAGQNIFFRGKPLTVQAFDAKKLEGIPFVLMSAGGAFSKENSPKLVEQGSIVIDNSSAWRMDDRSILCVPEINAHLMDAKRSQIIANPNCSTIQLVLSLQPLLKNFGIEHVMVTSFQSVSGTGQKGIEELQTQLQKLSQDPKNTWQSSKANVYAKAIACNVLPAIDRLDEKAHCFEEEKVVRETRKIFGLNDLSVLATTTRVPTFNCHGESVVVKLKKEVAINEVMEALTAESTLHVSMGTKYEDLPTSLEAKNSHKVHISRLRLSLDKNRDSWLQFWNIADNLRVGASTNAVRILKKLLNEK